MDEKSEALKATTKAEDKPQSGFKYLLVSIYTSIDGI